MKEVSNSLYLAGGIQYSEDFGRGWRVGITPLLVSKGYNVHNPIDHWSQEKGKSPEHVAELRKRNFKKFLDLMSEIIEEDINILGQCCGVVVKLDEPAIRGAGTIGELTYCKLVGIPVFTWIDIIGGIGRVPSWLLACSSEITYSLDELLEAVPDFAELDSYVQKKRNT